MVSIGVMGRTATETPARAPDDSGYIERDGVRVWWETHGCGERAILLMPTWSIVHSRHWKAQIHYLARHFRVVTFDGRGNGLSDRPAAKAAYADAEYVADAVAVLDATEVGDAVVAGLSCGGRYALALAAHHPDRVRGVVAIAPSVPFLTPPHPWRVEYDFDVPLEQDEGWAKDNRHYWLRDYRGFLEFFFSELFNEPHSTKQIEDSVAWGLDTSPEILLLTECDLGYTDQEGAEGLCRDVRAPVLVIHGDADRITPFERGVRVTELTSGQLVAFEGSGHGPQAREPVRVNQLIREFADDVGGRPTAPARWFRARDSDARCTSPRRSGSATRGATSRSRISCAAASPTWRSSGWRNRRSPRCWSVAARRSIPPARSSPANPRTSIGRPASTN